MPIKDNVDTLSGLFIRPDPDPNHQPAQSGDHEDGHDTAPDPDPT